MTNEEKVELRMLVMSMARTYRREEAQIGGEDIEQRFQTINDGRDSILSLIDRQPSEREKIVILYRSEAEEWLLDAASSEEMESIIKYLIEYIYDRDYRVAMAYKEIKALNIEDNE